MHTAKVRQYIREQLQIVKGGLEFDSTEADKVAGLKAAHNIDTALQAFVEPLTFDPYKCINTKCEYRDDNESNGCSIYPAETICVNYRREHKK